MYLEVHNVFDKEFCDISIDNLRHIAGSRITSFYSMSFHSNVGEEKNKPTYFIEGKVTVKIKK